MPWLLRYALDGDPQAALERVWAESQDDFALLDFVAIAGATPTEINAAHHAHRTAVREHGCAEVTSCQRCSDAVRAVSKCPSWSLIASLPVESFRFSHDGFRL